MPVITALQFLGACLLLGLGLVLASEAVLRVRRHRLGRALGSAAAALGGLVTVMLGGYFVALSVPW
jgi:hypothetical protein